MNLCFYYSDRGRYCSNLRFWFNSGNFLILWSLSCCWWRNWFLGCLRQVGVGWRDAQLSLRRRKRNRLGWCGLRMELGYMGCWRGGSSAWVHPRVLEWRPSAFGPSLQPLAVGSSRLDHLLTHHLHQLASGVCWSLFEFSINFWLEY